MLRISLYPPFSCLQEGSLGNASDDGTGKRSPHMFQLSFIPLEPYPARCARHLPHAGKALSVVILFPHMRVFALTLWGKRYSRIAAFPIGECFDAGEAVFSFCSLCRRCSGQCFCMTAEQPLEEGARRRRRMDSHSGENDVE